MIKRYFKTALRNLWRNRTFTVCNMAGLAVCLAIFVLIFDHLSTHTPIDPVIYSSSLSFVYFTLKKSIRFSLNYLFINKNYNDRFNAGNPLTNQVIKIIFYV
jgi:hypothetical protein